MKQLGHFKRRILKHYKAATEVEQVVGSNWYFEAHEFCRDTAKLFDVPMIKVVGILAALSPNNKWERNKIDLKLFLDTPSVHTKVCTFTNQRYKAVDIYWANDLNNQRVVDVLKGIKTSNFFSNILEPWTSKAVTVDMWAFRSCGVEPKAKYIKDVTQAYLEVSEQLNLKPHQLQAIVWGVVRGSHA